MKITELDALSRDALYVLCEDTRAIGDSIVCYRLYATLEKGKRGRFFVSVTEEGERDGALVPREGLEEAAALSDRIGIMAAGRLKAVGTLSELTALTGTSTLEDAFVALAAGEVKA